MNITRNEMASPAIPSDLKRSNRSQVLSAFFGGGVFSAGDIAAAVGLSRQTVMKSIQFFLQDGLLVSLGKGDSTDVGGKRPELFALTQSRFFLCISMWPDIIHIRLYTLGGKTVANLMELGQLPNDPQETVRKVCTLANGMMEEHQVAPEQLLSVLVSTSGTVDCENGILHYCALTPEWGREIPLVEYMRPYFARSTRILLDSAVKMMAYPVLSDSRFAGKRILTMFTSWIVASSFIDNNRIFVGHNSLLGELGHMIVDPRDPEECGCGGHGCLERMIDKKHIRALMQTYQSEHPESPLFSISEKQLSIPDIFLQAEQGDPLARHLVDYLAVHFSTALRNVAVAFDPDLVIFQGDYTTAHSYFDIQLQKNLHTFRYFRPEGPFETIYDTCHPVEMGIYGAYLALAHDYFNIPDHYIDRAVDRGTADQPTRKG